MKNRIQRKDAKTQRRKVKCLAPLRLCAFALIALTGFSARAAEAKFAWDYPGLTNNLVGFKLYAHTNSLAAGTNLPAALVKVSVPFTNLQATVQFTNALRWYFIVTSIDRIGLESVPSNEVIVEAPDPPPNARTVAVQYVPTISGTNWQDVGFFRLRLGP